MNAFLNRDVHEMDTQQDLFVPAPPEEGGVKQTATAVSAFGQLSAKLEQVSAAVAQLQEAQQGGQGQGLTGTGETMVEEEDNF